MKYFVLLLLTTLTFQVNAQIEPVFSSIFYLAKPITNVNKTITKQHKTTFGKIALANTKWYVCNNDSETITDYNIGATIGIFKDSTGILNTVYYDSIGAWLATEKRITVKTKYVYGYSILEYPTKNILPEKVRTLFLKKTRLDIKSVEEKNGIGYLDFYQLEVRKDHEVAIKNKTTTFYIVNLDELTFCASEKKIIKLKHEFYNFFEFYK